MATIIAAGRACDGVATGTTTITATLSGVTSPNGADGDGGDAAIDRGDAGQSVDREGADAAVHGDRHVQRQQTQNLTEPSDVGLGDASVATHHARRSGDGRRNRGTATISATLNGVTGSNGADGDGGDAAIDRGDAGQSERSRRG